MQSNSHLVLLCITRKREMAELYIPSSKDDLGLVVMTRDVHGESYLTVFDEAVVCYVNKEWERCLELSQILVHITWEHLNTGHWKDVHLSWRYAYTYSSLFKAVSHYFAEYIDNKSVTHLEQAIKTCDMGLLLGAPILDNVLARFVNFLQKELMKTSDPKQKDVLKHDDKGENGPQIKKSKIRNSFDMYLKLQNPLRSLSLPTVECFKRDFMEKCEPVILLDSMDHWPALKKWNTDYLKEVAGCRTVPIEIGSKYTEESWSQTLMLMSEFIERFIEAPSGRDVGYLAQHELFDQIPELQDDINIPTYCSLGEESDVDVNAWFGPKGTVSPLHHDPKHNFLCQVVGEKYIKLYKEDNTPYLYAHPAAMLFNTSQVDVENPDLEQYPEFKHAVETDCVLKPGQMLYIPPKCWHYVRSLSTSFSVSFWWN